MHSDFRLCIYEYVTNEWSESYDNIFLCFGPADRIGFLGMARTETHKHN